MNPKRNLTPPIPLRHLNQRRLSILLYIETYWQAHRRAPLLREIAAAHAASDPTIDRDIHVLLGCGFLERARPFGCSRALRLTAWQEAPVPCPCCGSAMHVYAVLLGKPDELSAECHSNGCQIAWVTLPLGEHEQLTDQQLASYARVNARRRATIEAVGD